MAPGVLNGLLELIAGKRLVYIRIRRNSMEARDVNTGKSASAMATDPFTTRRLLVGNFIPAETCLAGILRTLYGKTLRLVPPLGVIHPLEMTEDGLSFVEQRVLRECAEGAGCSGTIIHVGPDLSDQDVADLAKRNNHARGA